MVEIVLIKSATPGSVERFVPIIPDPTTTQASNAIPTNSETSLAAVFDTWLNSLTCGIELAGLNSGADLGELLNTLELTSNLIFTY